MLATPCSWSVELWDGRSLDTSGTETEYRSLTPQRGNSWWGQVVRKDLRCYRDMRSAFHLLFWFCHGKTWGARLNRKWLCFSDSSCDAGSLWPVSLWDQQQHWETVDQWGGYCDRYVTPQCAFWCSSYSPVKPALLLLTLIFCSVLDWKHQGYLCRFQGQWSALKVELKELVHG